MGSIFLTVSRESARRFRGRIDYIFFNAVNDTCMAMLLLSRMLYVVVAAQFIITVTRNEFRVNDDVFSCIIETSF